MWAPAGHGVGLEGSPGTGRSARATRAAKAPIRPVSPSGLAKLSQAWSIDLSLFPWKVGVTVAWVISWIPWGVFTVLVQKRAANVELPVLTIGVQAPPPRAPKGSQP